MSPELEDELVLRYPALFAFNRDWSTTGAAEHYAVACGDGWYGLVDRACSAVNDLAMRWFENSKGQSVWMPRVHIFTDPTPDPEQGGMLRFDLAGPAAPLCPTPAGIVQSDLSRLYMVAQGMSWMASEASFCICEVCGNAAQHANRRVRCTEHRDVSMEDAATFASRALGTLLLKCREPADPRLVITRVLPKKRRPAPKPGQPSDE